MGRDAPSQRCLDVQSHLNPRLFEHRIDKLTDVNTKSTFKKSDEHFELVKIGESYFVGPEDDCCCHNGHKKSRHEERKDLIRDTELFLPRWTPQNRP